MSEFSKGSFEIEVLEKEEDTWKRAWSQCKKNPGHPTFYLPGDFQMDHLPEKYRDGDLYNCILKLTKLVVRLTAHFKSSDNPRTNKRVVATGRVERLIRHDNDGTLCNCSVCQSSGKCSSSWAVIEICSAAHVVFMHTEATNIEWTLFFDDEATPGLTLKDSLVIESCDVAKDQCKLKYVTCDAELINNLNVTMDEYTGFWEKTHAEFKPTRAEDRMAVIVSHPHGGPKRISVGHWTELEKAGTEENVDVQCYKDTTSTCRGSSGAYVFIVGYNSGSWYQGFHQHIHSRTDNDLNFSAYGTFLDK